MPANRGKDQLPGARPVGPEVWTVPEESTCCMAGLPFRDPRPGVLLCYTDADRASDRTSRRSTSGGVVILGVGVLNCWAKKQRSVPLSSWESELFSAIMPGTRSLGIQSELEDHSVASKHVGLRGLWLEEAPDDKRLVLEKVHTAANPADVCAKALPADKIRELCRLARVYVCHSEEPLGGDSESRSLAQLDGSCRSERSERACEAQSEGAG